MLMLGKGHGPRAPGPGPRPLGPGSGPRARGPGPSPQFHIGSGGGKFPPDPDPVRTDPVGPSGPNKPFRNAPIPIGCDETRWNRKLRVSPTILAPPLYRIQWGGALGGETGVVWRGAGPIVSS